MYLLKKQTIEKINVANSNFKVYFKPVCVTISCFNITYVPWELRNNCIKNPIYVHAQRALSTSTPHLVPRCRDEGQRVRKEKKKKEGKGDTRRNLSTRE